MPAEKNRFVVEANYLYALYGGHLQRTVAGGRSISFSHGPCTASKGLPTGKHMLIQTLRKDRYDILRLESVDSIPSLDENR